MGQDPLLGNHPKLFPCGGSKRKRESGAALIPERKPGHCTHFLCILGAVIFSPRGLNSMGVFFLLRQSSESAFCLEVPFYLSMALSLVNSWTNGKAQTLHNEVVKSLVSPAFAHSSLIFIFVFLVWGRYGGQGSRNFIWSFMASFKHRARNDEMLNNKCHISYV